MTSIVRGGVGSTERFGYLFEELVNMFLINIPSPARHLAIAIYIPPAKLKGWNRRIRCFSRGRCF